MIDIEYLSKKLDMSPERTKSTVFWIVDHFMENISDEAIDCGAYHNSPLNGDNNMIESYKAILWAQYEEADGQKPQSKGPWVAIDPVQGITIHSERPVYVISNQQV